MAAASPVSPAPTLPAVHAAVASRTSPATVAVATTGTSATGTVRRAAARSPSARWRGTHRSSPASVPSHETACRMMNSDVAAKNTPATRCEYSCATRKTSARPCTPATAAPTRLRAPPLASLFRLGPLDSGSGMPPGLVRLLGVARHHVRRLDGRALRRVRRELRRHVPRDVLLCPRRGRLQRGLGLGLLAGDREAAGRGGVGGVGGVRRARPGGAPPRRRGGARGGAPGDVGRRDRLRRDRFARPRGRLQRRRRAAPPAAGRGGAPRAGLPGLPGPALPPLPGP